MINVQPLPDLFSTPEQLATLAVSALPRRARQKKSLVAAAIPEAVAMELSQKDMFGHFASHVLDEAARRIVLAQLQVDSPIPSPAPFEMPSSTEATSAEEDAALERALGGNDEALRAEQLAWHPTEGAIIDMHIACMEENLAVLLSKDRKADIALEKGQVLEWIFTVDEVRGVDVRSIPFSFVNCCICCDIADPDVFRAQLLQVPVVRDLLVQCKLAKESELPKFRPNRAVQYIDIVGADRMPDERIYMAGA